MANNGYVQVPPDSTGKKVFHVIQIELDYDNGTIAFEVGDTVIGATSGAEGSVFKISGNISSGELYIALSHESPVAFVVGENLNVGGTPHAKAASVGTSIYKPSISIVDHENSFNGVNVTAQGELITSPAEGSFGFDAFGALKVSQESYLGLYHFNYGIDWGNLYIGTGSAGGSVTTGSNYSGVIFSTPTDSGSVARIRSHLYHPYNAGTGIKWLGSIVVGDTGKANVIRRWGMFSQRDGLFFELSGSVMSVVIRNSSTGTAVETKIPQSEWNVDRADGQGGERNISEANMDVSKGFVYFFDFQWLGVGRVRFGIIWSGQRVVLHEFTHNAELTLPYMGQSNLPCCIEQINYDTAASTSELRTFSMAVIAASRHDSPIVDSNRGQTMELTKTVDWTGSFRPLFSVRSKNYLLGKENRAVAIPSELKVYSENAPFVFQVQKWPVLTGDTWTVPTSSYATLEGDVTATTASYGQIMLTDIVKANDVHYHSFPHEWNQAFKIHRKASITDDNCAWTVMGKLLNTNTAPSSSVTLIVDWHEIL